MTKHKDVNCGVPFCNECIARIKELKNGADRLLNSAHTPKNSKVDQPNSELYIILADYSNDLANLKKRKGMLPADYAAQQIEEYVNRQVVKARISEVRRFKRNATPAMFWDRLDAKFIGGYITNRIAELSTGAQHGN